MSLIIGAFDQARDYISSHSAFYPAAFVETVQNFGGVPKYLAYLKLDSEDPEILEQAAFYSALYVLSLEKIGSFPPPSDDPDIDADVHVPDETSTLQPVSPEVLGLASEEGEEDWESVISEGQEDEEEPYGDHDVELSESDSYDDDEGVEEEEVEEEEEEEDELPPSPAPAG
jgi:hypothetical protein